MADAYLWLKALHVISVIAWMAGLLYLPRLFVYHTTVCAGSEASETFKVMERKLLRIIMNPAAAASLITGGLLIVVLGQTALTSGWLHAKLTLLVALVVVHVMLARHQRAFAEDRNQRSGRYFRVMNEVPTLLMIGIVIVVVVKPF